VGCKGACNFWRFDTTNFDPEQCLVRSPDISDYYPHLHETDFTAAYMVRKQQKNEFKIDNEEDTFYYLILGTSDGAILCFDQEKYEFLNEGRLTYIDAGSQISHIVYSKDHLVIATSKGLLVRYPVKDLNKFEPPENQELIQRMTAESSISSLKMDEQNIEGIFGTSMGNIYYFNFAESQMVRIVTRATAGIDDISTVKFDFN
jgi:hypothetical protein